MRYAFVSSALIASASAHGVITSIEGANGVSMPGLSGTAHAAPSVIALPENSLADLARVSDRWHSS